MTKPSAEQTPKITVVGAGSWGTALATHLAAQHREVHLWARDPSQARALRDTRVNERYLPGLLLPEHIVVQDALDRSLAAANLVVWAVPSHTIREVLALAQGLFPNDALHCAAIKGIEPDTLLRVSQIFETVLPASEHAQLTYLGGPSFALEVAQGLPTAVCVAGHHMPATKQVQNWLHGNRFRVYATEDVVGVEIGGALKNVVAIAAGIADGLGFGFNARAALITRGLHEITRLAVALGGNPATMAGLAGMGDLLLTCTGDLSRNRTVGLKLAEGQRLETVLRDMRTVAEGVRTTKSAHELSETRGIELPIVREVYAVLYHDKSPKEGVAALMTRPPKHERL